MRIQCILAFVVVSTTNTIGITTTTTTTEAALTTLPLIPHHIQKTRRLKELQEIHGRDLQMDDEDIFDSHLPPPSQQRRRNEAAQVGALYHGYGTHYADVWVGTPPQRQTVIVDTGSGLTAFPCSGCEDCGSAPEYHTDTYFAFEDSSTFTQTNCNSCRLGGCNTREDRCTTSMSYQEGSSWFAFEAKDMTYVGGLHTRPLLKDGGKNEDIDPEHAKHFSFPMSFGCQYRLTGLFKTQLADGIMGMENSNTAFWKQLYDSGKVGQERKFSLCFSRPRAAARNGTEAGAMTFGGVETRLHDTQMVYTAKKTTRSSGFYHVKVRKMYLRHGDGGESARTANEHAKVINLGLDEAVYNAGGIIVDSGTTNTYFTRGISRAFRAAFKELSGVAFSHDSRVMTEKDIRGYPTILFQLYGDHDLNKAINPKADKVPGLAGKLDRDHPFDVIVAMPPSHYLQMDRSGKLSPRFYDDEDRGSVMGANLMLGHDILFDADNQNIGWAESDCDYKKLVTDGGYVDVLDTEERPDTISGSSNSASNHGGSTSGLNTGGSGETKSGSEATLPGSDKKDTTKPNQQMTNPTITPAEGDHGSTASSEDFAKTEVPNSWWSSYYYECDTMTCQGGLASIVGLILLCGLCCCYKMCCGGGGGIRSRKGAAAMGYKRTNLELSEATFRDDGAYEDNPDDDDDDDDDNDDDAEYGEFPAKK